MARWTRPVTFGSLEQRRSRPARVLAGHVVHDRDARQSAAIARRASAQPAWPLPQQLEAGRAGAPRPAAHRPSISSVRSRISRSLAGRARRPPRPTTRWSPAGAAGDGAAGRGLLGGPAVFLASPHEIRKTDASGREAGPAVIPPICGAARVSAGGRRTQLPGPEAPACETRRCRNYELRRSAGPPVRSRGDLSSEPWGRAAERNHPSYWTPLAYLRSRFVSSK